MVRLKFTKEQWSKALEQRHTKEFQKRFDNATVAICGLGGLGSNVASMLARAGVGKLILIDYDRVDITNLHRQGYLATQVGMPKTTALGENLRGINPFIRLETHMVKISEHNAIDLLSSADIICEAFDDAVTKANFTNFVLENMPKKYLVASSGMAGFGDANTIKTRKITEHFYVCGDFESDISDGIGLVCTRVMVCASHQAHKILQILLQEENLDEQ